MSMWYSVYNIECTECSFTYVPGLVNHVNRAYAYKEQLIPIPSKRAWCNNCETFTTIEKLQEKQLTLDDYITLMDGLSSRRLDYEGIVLKEKTGYFGKVRKTEVSAEDAFQLSKIVSDFSFLERGLRKLFEPKALREIFLARTSGPKCLECGSENLLTLDMPKVDSAHSETGPHHPGCAGTLFHVDGGKGLFDHNKQYPTKIFDTEGNFIDHIP